MILRRWLTYEDVDVAQIEKKQGESLADILRPAARHWAFAHGEVIRGFSTQRAGCCAQQGKVFRFEVEGEGNSISLRVGQAGHSEGFGARRPIFVARRQSADWAGICKGRGCIHSDSTAF